MANRSGLSVLVLFFGLLLPPALRAETPDAALSTLIDGARQTAEAADNCYAPGLDRLVRLLCTAEIRVGVRDGYPLFGARKDGQRIGYDVDVAQAIAERLNLEPTFTGVTPANRIALLGEDKIDLVIATLGHNSQRDGQARFIRPHYFQSQTVVIGPKDLKVSDWEGVAGKTVCVTVGNGSNAQMISHNTHLMLFESAAELPRRLRDETCLLAAQDNSFFDNFFTDADFADRFEEKFGFAQVPWGMAVARDGADDLARALELISQIFHRDGVFIEIAQRNRISTAFLEAQRAVWTEERCDVAEGESRGDCLLGPLDANLARTDFADEVAAFETWLADLTGIQISLPMFKTVPAWTLFKDGVINSLILVFGALAATFVFALILGAIQSSRHAVLHAPAHVVTVILQSSPVLLTVVIAATVAQSFLPYSSEVAIGAAVVALGLMNGSNAGQAISEAMGTLRREHGQADVPMTGLFPRAVARSATQIVSFLINAAKGTPVASIIGAPELLSSLTDITSFASGRATTYTMLLVFYILIVFVVIWLCEGAKYLLERRLA